MLKEIIRQAALPGGGLGQATQSVAPAAVAVGQTVAILAEELAGPAVLAAGLKFNLPRKKRCGQRGQVSEELVDGNVRVKFETPVHGHDGELVRVDSQSLSFPRTALVAAAAVVEAEREKQAPPPQQKQRAAKIVLQLDVRPRDEGTAVAATAAPAPGQRVGELATAQEQQPQGVNVQLWLAVLIVLVALYFQQ
jgi:hypothetical protein